MLTFLAVIHSSDESETISSTPSWNQAPTPTPSRGGHVALFLITMIARINLRARLRLCLVHAVKRNLGQAGQLCGYVLTGKYLTNLQLHQTVYDDTQRETIKKQLT